MDQALFIVTQIQGVGITLTNIQAFGGAIGIVISTLIMWGLMTKNINEKIKGKADEKETVQRFVALESKIDTTKEQFLFEITELRKDLRLKKDKQ